MCRIYTSVATTLLLCSLALNLAFLKGKIAYEHAAPQAQVIEASDYVSLYDKYGRKK